MGKAAIQLLAILIPLYMINSVGLSVSHPNGAPRPFLYHAYFMCKDGIEKRLKAPATADFPFAYTEAMILGDKPFLICSHVDAQNGFGAQVRTNFVCMVRDGGNGSWRLEAVELF